MVALNRRRNKRRRREEQATGPTSACGRGRVPQNSAGSDRGFQAGGYAFCGNAAGTETSGNISSSLSNVSINEGEENHKTKQTSNSFISCKRFSFTLSVISSAEG